MKVLLGTSLPVGNEARVVSNEAKLVLRVNAGKHAVLCLKKLVYEHVGLVWPLKRRDIVVVHEKV